MPATSRNPSIGHCGPSVYTRYVGLLRGIVRNGRLIVDDAVDYPEGTKLQLRIVEDTDNFDLTDEEWADLEMCVVRGIAETQTGQGRPAREYLAELHTRP